MHKKGCRLPALALGGVIVLLLAGFAVPGSMTIPVAGASGKDWNPHSFWYSPWGVSGAHKGIDIFAREGTSVVSAGSGVVVYTGYLSLGGNVVAVLGPKWRIHYYAHLKTISVNPWMYVEKGQPIGAVGTTGNAKGKPPHLHFAVITMIPYVWRADIGPQGWKKMFFLNPDELLRKEIIVRTETSALR